MGGDWLSRGAQEREKVKHLLPGPEEKNKIQEVQSRQGDEEWIQG